MGRAYIQIRADLSRIAHDIRTGVQRAVATLHLSQFNAWFARAGASAANAFSRGFNRGLDLGRGLLRTLRPLAMMIAKWGSIAVGAFQTLAPVVAELLPAVLALAAALPALLAAAATSAIALKLALKGVGDAVGAIFTDDPAKLAEALKKLTPAARKFVLEINASKKLLRGIQQFVQEEFFKPLTGGFKALVKSQFFTWIRLEMGGIAKDAGKAARGVLDVFSAASKSGELKKALGPIGESFRKMAGVIPGLAKAFLTLTTAAGPFVEILVGAAASGLEEWFDKLDQAAKSGALAQLFEDGMQVLGDLGNLLKDLGSIVKSVFTAFTEEGGSVLGVLGALAHELAEFLKSAEGQAFLRDLAATLKTIGRVITDVVQPLLGPLGQLISAVLKPLAGVLEEVSGPLGELACLLGEELTLAIETAKPWLDILIRAFGDLVSQGLQDTVDHIKTMMPHLERFADQIGPKMTPLVQAFADAMISLSPLIPEFARLIQGSIPLIEALMPAILFTIQGSTNTIRAFGVVIDWLVVLIEGAVTATIQHWNMMGVFFGLVWEGIKFTLAQAWGFIRPILALIGLAFDIYIVKPITWMWEKVKPIIDAFGVGIEVVWEDTIKPALEGLGLYISTKIPNFFKKGADDVGTAWDKLKRAAAAPVEWVIDVVINKGIIDTFNKVAKMLGQPGVDHVPNPFAASSGGGGGGGRSMYYAAGGPVPGGWKGHDDRMGFAPGGMVKFGGGEFIVNAAATSDYLPVLRWINDQRKPLGAQSKTLTGSKEQYAAGGLVGNLLSAADMMLAFTDPGKFLHSAADTVLKNVPGGGSPMAGLAVGLGEKALSLAITAMKKFVLGGPGSPGAPLGPGGIGSQAMMAILRSVFPGLPLLSGFRPGSRVASGGLSYHAFNRAVDIPPIMAVANWIAATWGARTKELIHTPMGPRQIKNGQPHVYSGPVVAQHYDHIHWAVAGGGQIPAFGDGGVVTSPTLAMLGDRGPEVVLPLNGRSPITVRVYIGNRELTEIVNTQVSYGLSAAGHELSIGARG